MTKPRKRCDPNLLKNLRFAVLLLIVAIAGIILTLAIAPEIPPESTILLGP